MSIKLARPNMVMSSASRTLAGHDGVGAPLGRRVDRTTKKVEDHGGGVETFRGAARQARHQVDVLIELPRTERAMVEALKHHGAPGDLSLASSLAASQWHWLVYTDVKQTCFLCD